MWLFKNTWFQTLLDRDLQKYTQTSIGPEKLFPLNEKNAAFTNQSVEHSWRILNFSDDTHTADRQYTSSTWVEGELKHLHAKLFQKQSTTASEHIVDADT